MAETVRQKYFFKGGAHPEDSKVLSCGDAICDAPLLAEYRVILHQHIGAPPKLLVEKGSEVKKGQVLAESGGFVSAPLHCPTSGKVADIADVPGPIGPKMKAAVIASDGKDESAYPFEPIKKWTDASPEELKQRVSDGGIVGMGGAAFPTFVKLSPPGGTKIDTLILNGAECEPYLTADHRLMLEHTDAVLEGAAILGRILQLKDIWIGVENNKPDAIALLETRCQDFGVRVMPLKVRYPQGAEKQLIYAVTGRKVPAGGLPMNVGCVVQNVGTAFAVKEAVYDGKPLFERITTVTGTPVSRPGNWRFRIGTPISEALKLAGGIKSATAKVISGGPMMGFALKSLDVPVMKNTSGILLLAPEEVSQFTSEPCIRCGRCVVACPMNLIPATISLAVENEKFGISEEYHAMDCMECGCCAYVCPAHRPLVQQFKRAKMEIAAKRKK